MVRLGPEASSSEETGGGGRRGAQKRGSDMERGDLGMASPPGQAEGVLEDRGRLRGKNYIQEGNTMIASCNTPIHFISVHHH
ncbi:hypothetical protein GW17_00037569 [Ensete ventricosum]|nr:hypothetical protein GW17_00037569 [Ensete ventricosum]